MDIRQNLSYTINYLLGNNVALGDHLYDYVSNHLDNYPGNYLEIGVFNGDGFSSIANKFPNKICYAIDPFIEDGHTEHSTGVTQGDSLLTQKENFIINTKDLKNIVHYQVTSVNFYNQLEASQIEQMDISVIVIDGSHHYNDVVNDCKLSIKLLSKRKLGLIIFDDLHVEGVRQAYDEFCREYKNNIEQFGSSGNNSDYIKIQL